jgi:hypothetical protein
MTPIKLFTVTLLPLVRVGLRRYQGLAGGWRCGPNRRHEATVWLDAPEEQAIGDHRRLLVPEQAAGRSGQAIKPHSDRWPTACAQGTACTHERVGEPVVFPAPAAYPFTAGDHAVVLHERLGRRDDTGEQVLAYSPPVGGVVELDFLFRGCLGIGTPDGLWYVDVTGKNGETFTRGRAGPLTITQTAGPAWRWRVVEDMLLEEVPGAG